MDSLEFILQRFPDRSLLLHQNIFEEEKSNCARRQQGKRNSEEKEKECCYFQVQHADLADGTEFCMKLINLLNI